MDYLKEAKDSLKGGSNDYTRTYALVSIAESLVSLVNLMQAQAEVEYGEIVSTTPGYPSSVVLRREEQEHANGPQQPAGWPQ
jgi:hypothetical protein